MEQYIIVNERYTRGQKNIISKLDSLFGKVFTESSLKTEINKIFPYSSWSSSILKGCLVITSNHLDMKLTAKFKKLPYQEYKLIQVEYL